jgi:hypothetical protein
MTLVRAEVPVAASHGHERRRASRRVPDAGEPLTAVRVRGGRELAVVDVSDAGVLVEGAARLLPGTHVEVHVMTTDGRVLVRTRVVRAWVSALGDGVRYRSALAFEHCVNTAAAPPVSAVRTPST